jgi:hypothetical protein
MPRPQRRRSPVSSSTKTEIMVSSAWCFRKNVLHVVGERLDTPMQLILGQAAQPLDRTSSYRGGRKEPMRTPVIGRFSI